MKYSIIADYLDGGTVDKLAVTYGVASTTVGRFIREAGIARTLSETKLGELNPNWSGNLQYAGLHQRVRRNKESDGRCESCGLKKKLDLANVRSDVNKETYTTDLKNWRYLCRKCHMIEDGRMKNLKRGRYG